MTIDQTHAAGPEENPPLPQADSESETTGLPLLVKWWAIYLVVILVFVFWLVLLTALPRVFS